MTMRFLSGFALAVAASMGAACGRGNGTEVVPDAGSDAGDPGDAGPTWPDGGFPDGARYHPLDYATPGADLFHGKTAAWELPACMACHGNDLLGGPSNVSCEQCHNGWQTSCVRCHGGTDNATGAPPKDLAGGAATDALTVGAHTAHVSGRTNISKPFDCDLCHPKPESALSPGHIDAPPASVVFGTVGATGWDRTLATCSVYCHGAFEGGDAANLPAWTDTGGSAAACGTCHARPPASGLHQSHASRGAACLDCHPDADAAGTAIVDPPFHVNGVREVILNRGGAWDGRSRSCTDSCHLGKRHWTGPTGIHPVGFVEKDASGAVAGTGTHGADANLGLGPCAVCHGADLSGGTSTVSCDACHLPFSADWPTDCTFCHGTRGVPSGAPPADVAGSSDVTSLGVGAHRSHLDAPSAISSAVACSACHLVPADALSTGHVDPRPAEVVFARPSSTGWNRSTATCGVYCHGVFGGGNEANQPAWTSVGLGLADCGTCHANPPASGGHLSHSTDATSVCMRAADPSKRCTGCVDCHDDASADATRIALPAKHVDGRKDVLFRSELTSSWDPGANSCGATSCHSTAEVHPWANGGHPAGFVQRDAAGAVVGVGDHGAAAIADVASCKGCHGAALQGGAPGDKGACDGCHTAGWRTNCTYCHGGQDDQTGAPPIDVTGGTATATASVGAHTSHVAGRLRISTPLNCAKCHAKPTDALSAGHWDPSPAEVRIGGSTTAYDKAAGTCAEYCHGAFPGGRSANRPRWTNVGGTAASCGTCHDQRPATGKHAQHAATSVRCSSCHDDTNAAGDAIAIAAKHVDGVKDVTPLNGGSFANGACNVYCHGAFTGGDASNRPSWTTGTAQTCSSCHPAAPATGKHAQHKTEGYACDVCHSDVDAAGTTITQAALHVNGAKDLSNPWGLTISAPGGNCTSYCHGNFSGGTTANKPNWLTGPAQTCSSCHPASPSTADHRLHLQKGMGCNQCHPDANSAGTAITQAALHVNHLREVKPMAWDAAGRTCNPNAVSRDPSWTISCHGSERW